MKILMYCPYFPPQYSGAAKQAVTLAKNLNRLNHYVEFVTIKDPGLPELDYFEDFIVHRIESGGKRGREIPFWSNFLKFVWNNRHRFEILHSHGAHYINSIVGPLAKLVGWRSLVKATMSQSDLNGLKGSISGNIHYFFLKMVDAYVAISSDLVEEFETNGLHRKRIFNIPNGVDVDLFRPPGKDEKLELRKILKLPLNRPIILNVGVFQPRKNIDWLMKEWVKHNGFETNAFLLMIGPKAREDTDGSFLASLKDIAKNHSNNMSILGHVDNIEEYYRAADVFIFPSVKEGLPNVVLEAMASGLPCIATSTSGTRELIVDGVTGYSFEPNNTTEFFEKLLKILSGVQIAELGQNARMMAMERFSIYSIALRYEKLYEKLLTF